MTENPETLAADVDVDAPGEVEAPITEPDAAASDVEPTAGSEPADEASAPEPAAEAPTEAASNEQGDASVEDEADDIRARLVAEAEALSTSTSWVKTGDAFVELTARWENTRAPADEAFEERFRAALSTFLDARAAFEAEREEAYEAARVKKEELIAEAESLAERTDAKAVTRMRTMMDDWKAAGHAGHAEPELWERFRAIRDAFHAARTAREDAAKKAKEDLVAEAVRLADSTDWRATQARFDELMEAWKAAGRARKSDDDRLWGMFHVARRQFQDARRQASHERASVEKAAKAAKRDLIERAQKASEIENLADALAELQALMAEWKQVGHAGRDDRKLWEQFKAAQDAGWARRHAPTVRTASSPEEALAIKKALVKEAKALVFTTDYKAGRLRMDAMMAEWKAAGRGKEREDKDLWDEFKSARDLFYGTARLADDHARRSHTRRPGDTPGRGRGGRNEGRR